MAAVPNTILRQWVFNAPDAAIRDSVCTIEFTNGYANFSKPVRGRWLVSLTDGNGANLTSPVTITNPKRAPFRLGSLTRRVQYGTPVYLQILASARDGAEALFWDGALAVNCTVSTT